jgi:monofunctional biosynthetic peptidoglycan transglycosylase
MRLIARLFRAFLWLLAFSVLWALAYRWLDPPTTYLMLRDRLADIEVKQDWADLAAMSPHLPRAVIAAEDARFCAHRGFDIEAIEKAYERNREGGRLRGGSTISQQTAKNAFLWPGRTMVRKGLEAWFTVLIELLWGKARIMEVYLNVAEFGRGVFGAEAAARHYFGVPAAKLSRAQAARLAAILPQPIERDAANPGRYTRRYAGQIAARSRVVANESLDSCIH